MHDEQEDEYIQRHVFLRRPRQKGTSVRPPFSAAPRLPQPRPGPSAQNDDYFRSPPNGASVQTPSRPPTFMNGHWRLLLRGLTDGGKSHPRTSLIRCLGGAWPVPGVAVGAADGAGAPWRRGPHSTASSWGKAPRELDRPRKARVGLYVDACACARHTERRAHTHIPNAAVPCAHVLCTRTIHTHVLTMRTQHALHIRVYTRHTTRARTA